MMVSAHSQALLVPTKLTAPQPSAAWIARDRLLATLGAGPATRLTLVVAPAGFGKSTLVAQWLVEAPRTVAARGYAERAVGAPAPPVALPARPVAWLTLDEHDQDGLRFLAYVAGAIERAAPGALATTLQLLGAPEPPPQVVLQALLVELSALPDGLTLVLDDYHVITAGPIHQMVAYLLRQLPLGCHLVLLSRVDPPLQLARLRAGQQITEVRAADLRFTEGETRALLASLLRAPPDEALVVALHQQTEGWAIALQLAALAQLELRGPGPAQDAAVRQITDYLADEVFDRQPPELRQTLLALAVPERFCAELCAALSDPPLDLIRAESLLEQLVRADVFLISLDAQGRWYRFHHLFRDLLLRRLRLAAGQAGLRALQMRSAQWLAAEGLVDEAVRHYLAAGSQDAAAELVERQLLPEAGTDVPRAPAGYWLRLLPADLIARRPGLALIVARLSVSSMDMGDLHASLARVDALLADPEASSSAPPWPSFQADLSALRGVLCAWQGRPAETIDHMRSALGQGPTTSLAVQALLQLGLSYVAVGDYAAGVRLIEAGLPAAVELLGERHAVYQQACLAAMHRAAGELAAQAQAARRLVDELAKRGSGELGEVYAATSFAMVAYERSDLPAAAAHFGALMSRKYKVSYAGYMGGVVGLALVAAARGSFPEAAALVQEAAGFAAEAGGAYLRDQALGCAVRVALAQGDVAAAFEAAGEIGVDMHLGMSLALETPRLSQVRALIAAGDVNYLARAEAILSGCLAEIEPLHNSRLLISALAIQALLRQAQGRPDEAQVTLERAVTLAAPRGFVRTFVDLGPALASLLRTLADRGVSPAYLQQVLAAFGPAPLAREWPERPAPRAELPELLTRRELEILALLAERWSDKEIAQRLVIAPNTVRKHTSTIYEKLGVSSRREAVDVARTCGLLP